MTPVRSMPTLSVGMIPPSTRTLTLTMTACRIRQLISLKIFQKESTHTPHPRTRRQLQVALEAWPEYMKKELPQDAKE